MREIAAELAPRALSPYSKKDEAAVILLSDGAWIPGVRVESASFSLTIPAILNAVTTAVSGARSDVVAIVQSRPYLPEEIAYLHNSPFARLAQTGPETFALSNRNIPFPGNPMDLTLGLPRPLLPEDGVAAARAIARSAHVTESNYAVGCIVELTDGSYISGVNVENRDWSRVLCAERNALGTAISYGLAPIESLYLACPSDSSITPCGACRQLLAECAPQCVLWLDRGVAPPASTDPLSLLPAPFLVPSVP